MTDLVVRLTTSRTVGWWIRRVASRLDPLILRATNGRLTSMGPPGMPMLTLTTTGRRSGWAGERFRARSRPLDETEKRAVWDDVRRAIPQVRVYEQRTDRDIRVFRPTRID